MRIPVKRTVHQRPPINVPLHPTLPTKLQEEFERSRSDATAHDQQPLTGYWIEEVHPNADRYFLNPRDRVLTKYDPRESDNAIVFQAATDKIHQHLAEMNIQGDVSIVLGLENGSQGTSVLYYLVDRDCQAIFWLEDVFRVTRRISPGHTEACLRQFFLRQYWYHVHHFPPTVINLLAERNLMAILLEFQVPGSLSPWTPDECHHYLAAIEYNIAARSEKERMADIGLLLSSIYHQQHDKIHNSPNRRVHRGRAGAPVLLVPPMNPNQAVWSSLLQSLVDPEHPLGVAVAYCVLLTGANRYLRGGGPLTDLMVFMSLAVVIATLLLCFASPGLCLVMVANIFEHPASARLRSWILSTYVAFNLFVSGCILSALGDYLNGQERHHSTAGLVLVAFVLALSTAFHAWRLSYDLD